MLFDSHAHFDDRKFDEFSDEGITLREKFLDRAFGEDGVGCIVNAGTSTEHNRAAIALAEKYPRIYATAGIHPEELYEAESDREGTISELRQMLEHPKVVALGEIGLDYHYDEPSRELQNEWFELQMRLAEELEIPVQIHDRDAHGDCMEMVRKFPKVKGVFHSYSGSAEMARQLVDMGWYISFSGVITFKNAARMAEVVRSVPLDRILAETDSPYLAPHPNRGKLNYSGYVRYTVERMAELKEISYEEMKKITFDNACRFFGIDSSLIYAGETR